MRENRGLNLTKMKRKRWRRRGGGSRGGKPLRYHRIID